MRPLAQGWFAEEKELAGQSAQWTLAKIMVERVWT